MMKIRAMSDHICGTVTAPLLLGTNRSYSDRYEQTERTLKLNAA